MSLDFPLSQWGHGKSTSLCLGGGNEAVFLVGFFTFSEKG